MELFDSLDLVPRVDAEELVRFVQARGNAAASGALGFWLERELSRLGVPSWVLESLRALSPPRSRYALGAKPGTGRAAKGWNVILPAGIVDRQFEGL